MSRAGIRNFNRCQNRTVDITSSVFIDPDTSSYVHEQGLIVSRPRGAATAPSGTVDSKAIAGFKATLQCPRSRGDNKAITSEYTNHASSQAAFESLRDNAGRLVCDNCMFARLSPQESAVLSLDLAEQELQRIKAVVERLGIGRDILRSQQNDQL